MHLSRRTTSVVKVQFSSSSRSESELIVSQDEWGRLGDAEAAPRRH